MKNFARTLGGKTLLFIVCVISVVSLVLCAALVFFYVESDLNIYIRTKEAVRNEVIDEVINDSMGHSLVWYAASKMDAVAEEREFDYIVTDQNGTLVLSSATYLDVETWEHTAQYCVTRDAQGNVSEIFSISSSYYPSETGTNTEVYSVSLAVRPGSDASRIVDLITKLVDIAYELRYAVYVLGVISLLLAILSFVGLMGVSGRHPGSEELFPGPLNKVPFDILAVICIGAAVLPLLGINEYFSFVYHDAFAIVLFAGVLLLDLCLLVGLCMSAACRIKQKKFFENTAIGFCLKFIWKGLVWLWKELRKFCAFVLATVRNIPIVWKTALAAGIFLFIDLCIMMSGYHPSYGLVFIDFIVKFALAVAAIWFAVALKKLKKGGEALAAGDLSYHVDTKGMVWDLKKHGENLNNIAGGMAIAVEDRLKSERMKTELITNVSHDIKTPLTSIINYADLISKEPCDNEKITEYSEVLTRQSEKLKRLIDDLVEASKASTGNLEVMLAPCNASVFLEQADGEYDEKLKAAGLELITKVPEKELRIMADGRRMQRIFDNLMNNICKYAQEGTRVYLSLEELDGNAVISFKNTSRDPLDMSEEELMERFTRGDSSRTTEGNGLGLSIAKSMAELQGGSLKLSIDGDLFKAILSFPLI